MDVTVETGFQNNSDFLPQLILLSFPHHWPGERTMGLGPSSNDVSKLVNRSLVVSVRSENIPPSA